MACICLLHLTKLISVCFCRNKPHILKELLMNPSAFPHPIRTSSTSPWDPVAQSLPSCLSSTPVSAKIPRPPLYLPTTRTAHTHHEHCMCTHTQLTHTYILHVCMHMVTNVHAFVCTCTRTRKLMYTMFIH